MIGNHLLGDAVSGNSAVTHLSCNGCTGIGNLGTTTIVDAEHHIDDLVVLGAFHCHFKLVNH